MYLFILFKGLYPILYFFLSREEAALRKQLDKLQQEKESSKYQLQSLRNYMNPPKLNVQTKLQQMQEKYNADINNMLEVIILILSRI